MATCKSCGAEIEYIKTPGGKAHPIDAKPEKRWIEQFIKAQYEDHLEIPSRYSWTLMDAYISHFATCPQSKDWSGKGKKP